METLVFNAQLLIALAAIVEPQHVLSVTQDLIWKLQQEHVLPAFLLVRHAKTPTLAQNVLTDSTWRLSTIKILANAWPAVLLLTVKLAEEAQLSVRAALQDTQWSRQSAFQIKA
jgi:hypothetical protein